MMNQKIPSILSITQQNKLHQLQSEIEVLEMQIDNILKEQAQLTTNNNSPIYLRDYLAKTGIKLAYDIDS